MGDKNFEYGYTVTKQTTSGVQELAASAEQLNMEGSGLNELMDQFTV